MTMPRDPFEPEFDPVQEVNPFFKGFAIALGFTAVLVLVILAIIGAL